jgi:molybdate transport system ATP-binding protein
MPPFLSLNKVIPLIPDSPFQEAIDWQIHTGEMWAIIGPNACGKSLLAQTLRLQFALGSGSINYHFLDKEEFGKGTDTLSKVERFILVLSFDSVYSLANYSQMYYQQRYNNTEMSPVPRISDLFRPENKDSEILEQISDIFKIEEMMDRKLIQLSSGELRKFMIARLLLKGPKMIVFDNPFVGLDAKSRNKLDDIFLELNQLGFQQVFLVPSIHDIPEFTTHILEINHGVCISKSRNETCHTPILEKYPPGVLKIDWHKITSSPTKDYKVLVNMENVGISHGDHEVVSEISWTINRGENWALLGPNGSGKSTLLSCIYADNPVAYAKNITLFDRKRGTGESIWDIKHRIGFTSSELHLYYRQNISCLEVVESGFFDSIGIHKKCSLQQTIVAEYIMDVLSIVYLQDRSFIKISSGEQCLVLFARALVKNPDLLILDEPFHGLDDGNKVLCKQIVESFCSQKGKSLIFVTHCKEEIPDCVDKILELS